MSRMSERPYEGSSQDPADTQMFRAFVDRADEEDTGRRWVLPVVLFVVLVIVAAVIVLVTLN